MSEAATEWRAAHERVCDLVLTTAAAGAAMEWHVPACPDWTARDLLAHMVGLDHDVLAGQEADDHNADWTQAQVDARRDHAPEQIVGEWRAMADDLVQYIEHTDPRPLGDAIIHEQDLRGALGVPGARDTAGLASVRDQMAGRLAERVSEAGLAPVRLESDTWTWASDGGGPGLVLRASAYDLTRALTSRRTEAQLRSWVVAGSLDPYLDVLAGVGPLPEQELRE